MYSMQYHDVYSMQAQSSSASNTFNKLDVLEMQSQSTSPPNPPFSTSKIDLLELRTHTGANQTLPPIQHIHQANPLEFIPGMEIPGSNLQQYFGNIPPVSYNYNGTHAPLNPVDGHHQHHPLHQQHLQHQHQINESPFKNQRNNHLALKPNVQEVSNDKQVKRPVPTTSNQTQTTTTSSNTANSTKSTDNNINKSNSRGKEEEMVVVAEAGASNAEGFTFLPMQLDFNSTTWQNRPARIYLSAEGIDSEDEHFADLANFSKFLVLSSTAPTQQTSPRDSSVEPPANTNSPRPSYKIKTVNYDGREVKIFNYHTLGNPDIPFIELQVWRREFQDNSGAKLFQDSQLLSGGNTHKPNQIWFEKMGSTKRDLYLTINCEKGLKVQDLFVVGILKLGNTIYISPDTSFPASSNRRKIPSSGSLVSPRGGGITSNSPMASPRTGSSSSLSHSGSSIGSNFSGAPAGGPFLPTSSPSESPRSFSTTRSKPYDKSSPGFSDNVDEEVTMAWSRLEDELMRCSEFDFVDTMREIENQLKKQIDVEGNSLDKYKSELIEWIDNGSAVVPKEYLIHHCLVLPAAEKWFFGGISGSTASRLLLEHYQKAPSNDYFLVRLSKTRKPYYALDARYTTDERTGEHLHYNARIMFQWDEQLKKVFFFMDTQLDAIPSRCDSLKGVIDYVVQRTHWKALPSQMYDSVGLPPLKR